MEATIKHLNQFKDDLEKQLDKTNELIKWLKEGAEGDNVNDKLKEFSSSTQELCSTLEKSAKDIPNPILIPNPVREEKAEKVESIPLPAAETKSKPSRPKIKGRKPPTKKFLSEKAKAEGKEEINSTKLEKVDLPEDTKEVEDSESTSIPSEAKKRVPTVNSAVLGELSSILSARTSRSQSKASPEEASPAVQEEGHSQPAKTSPPPPAKAEVESKPQAVKPNLKPTPFGVPPGSVKLFDTKQEPEESKLPPWKLELQKRKAQSDAHKSAPKPFKAPENDSGNELAAILQRRKQKSEI